MVEHRLLFHCKTSVCVRVSYQLMDMPEKAYYLGTLSTRNQMHSSQTRSRAANKHLRSTFASDTYGRHATHYCRTPPVSINRLYQVGVTCSRWWHLVIGYYEQAVALRIRLHFDNPLRKPWRLWVHGDWADEPYTHAWGYSPVESKRLANCVF